MSEEMRLDGEIEKIIYQNKENGYTVCLMRCGEESISVVGILPAIAAGETLHASGHFETHREYGKQFRVSDYEKDLPRDTESILRYLSSRALRGIGPKTAQRIVERFGEDTLSVLENSPGMLSAVRGITPKKAQEIGMLFREQFGLRQVLLHFSGAFGTELSLRIHRAFGAGAVELVTRNPYLLCEKVRGIGFVRADKLAESLGIEKNSPARLRAGLLYTLKESFSRDGHVFLPRGVFLRSASELLCCSEEALSESLAESVAVEELVDDEGRIYLPEAYCLEQEAAQRIVSLSRIQLTKELPNVEELISCTETDEGILYADCQKEAIRRAATESVSIITGGPGTGKTTLTRALSRLCFRAGLSVCLCAPTGRAAKRMSESSHFCAKTIHRTLEMGFTLPESGEPQFGRDEKNPLSEDVFLIDEMSMVDLPLFCSFLRAVKPGARLIFIGDADQLPSVGAGDVLHDLIRSGAFPVTTLNEIFRQEKGSGIVCYAHEVCAGKIRPLRANGGDLFFLRREEKQAAAETIAQLLQKRLPEAYGEEECADAQVLCAQKKGPAGTIALNALLQTVLNPKAAEKREVAFGSVVFREKDRVMQIRNDYELEWRTEQNGVPVQRGLGVFNGDVGCIEKIDEAREVLTVDFDGQKVDYPFGLLPELEHAFAVTVHKSQGSEYKTVLFALCMAPPMLMTRALYYTAITRAKKRLILVGEERVAATMTENNAPCGRYSLLAERIREL